MKYYELKNTSPKFCGLVTVLDYDDVKKHPEFKEEYEYAYKYIIAREPMPDINEWKPIRFRPYKEAGKNKKVADYHNGLLFSSRAVDALGHFFEKHGQFYPIIVEDYDDDRDFFMYYCTTIIDCLDNERSTGKYHDSDDEHMIIVYKAFFKHNKIPEDVDVFNIPYGHMRGIFISERIKQALEAISPALTGFELVPEGEDMYGGVFS